jgi:hypothetical protein
MMRRKDDIKRLSGSDDINEIIECHNLRTGYTCDLVALSIAARPSKGVIPTLDRIIGRSFLVLEDKTSPLGEKARLAILPRGVYQQIEAYWADWHRTRAALSLLNLELVMGGYKLWRPCFIVGGRSSFELREVTPCEIERHTSEYLDLPANWARTFLGTILPERGAPRAFVDALLGHWSLSKEPYGDYSTLSPVVMQQFVEKWISKLLIDLGMASYPSSGSAACHSQDCRQVNVRAEQNRHECYV